MVGLNDWDRGAIELCLPGGMVGTADAEQGWSSRAHVNGEGVIAISVYRGGTGASSLTNGQYRLIYDRRLGGVEGGRPE